MIKKVVLFLMTMVVFGLSAQENNSLYVTKKIAFTQDTIKLEKNSINDSFLSITQSNKKPLDANQYSINFKKGFLLFTPSSLTNKDTLTVTYLKLPEALTKEYSFYNSSQVVPSEAISGQLYAVKNSIQNKTIPFDGLTTTGSISRGFTVGNNQNTVLNSNLDLQITGKISDKVSLRASIQDSNIPLQDGGYSQRLDQFDNVFMEIFSTNWKIRAGDIFLENNTSQFLNFTKKVQGLTTEVNFGTPENKTSLFASAALVRGQYAKSNFVGQEGNQGPYKLKGSNGELYVVVISGSERVYVNGRLLERGENKDYIIDYNAGEIIFTPLFTIASDMRIAIEYQFSEQNYSRFVGYGGATHQSKKWDFGSYLYSETDLKNQTLQQNLSQEQIAILNNAGDDKSKMNAPSAYEDTFSENKVLYKKVIANTIEYFEYSNDSSGQLFNVRYSFVGENNGNYLVKNGSNLSRVYQYVAPINQIKQGNYEPIIALVAPTKIQVATFVGKYKSNEKTTANFEIGISNNDKNLFSSLEDGNNNGIAAKIDIKQRLYSKKWHADAFANYQYIQDQFGSVERFNTIEFDRDWNITSLIEGSQRWIISGIDLYIDPKAKSSQSGLMTTKFEKLDLGNQFSGNRNSVLGFYQSKNWLLYNNSSLLITKTDLNTSRFFRNSTKIQYQFDKNWIGAKYNTEDNQEKNKITHKLSAFSQKFNEYEMFLGRGDSTKIYVELAYLRRTNDSLQKEIVQRVNHLNEFSLKSQLIRSNKSNLTVYFKYRMLEFTDALKEKIPSLNSGILYTDTYFDQLLQNTTLFETNSGTIAQQEFTYLEVAPGQGVYTWIDYNNNGVQELQEFEIAPFPDQAIYIRVYLPNQIYSNSFQNKFSESVTFNPNRWQNETGIKKIVSHFYNQTSFLLDKKTKTEANLIDLNPFDLTSDAILGLNTSFRNSLFYNRAKQNHSVTYSYLKNQTVNLLSIGSLALKNNSHQIQYTHLYRKSWLLNAFGKTINSGSEAENFAEKNFRLTGYVLNPKISYLFTKNTSLDFFYELQKKENQIGNFETLLQNKLGTSFSYANSKKIVVNGELSFFQNKFDGNENSAVAFQMLEGLQTGQNLVWRLFAQKNITQFLDINLNYQGRKSESSTAIHTGSIQLRAYF